MKAIKQTKVVRSIVSHEGFADVLTNHLTEEKSLHSTLHFSENDVIQNFSAATIVNIPTYLTVQINLHEHITLQPTYLQYINHSCNPNAFFNTTTFELIALKEIKPGDEITFFYPSTEWNMTQNFVCTCGYKDCLQNIKGAAHISIETLINYRLTDFIQSMLVTQ